MNYMTYLYHAIGPETIDPERLLRAIYRGQAADWRSGAVITFNGIIRNHDAGRGVERLDFSSHPRAEAVLGELVAQVGEDPQVHAVVAVHRVGRLEIGDMALFVAVAAEHRSTAFRQCSWLVDEIKRQVPIWKNQHFTDGDSKWVGLP